MIVYDFSQKSTVETIRESFDQKVDYFSDLTAGHRAAMDSRLIMELIAAAAARTTPHARSVLDIGCGAGNYTIQVLTALPGLDCTLVDLSRPMLDRAHQRVSDQTTGQVATIQGDIREVKLATAAFDLVITGSALHHLRQDQDWETVFAKIYHSLRPGGSLWISDLVAHDHPAIQALLWEYYGHYLESAGGEDFRNRIFANIEVEDTPRSLGYQISLLTRTGFVNIEILHKHACFAAFGGVKK